MRRLIQTISFRKIASMQYSARQRCSLIDEFIDEIIKFSNSGENPETIFRVLSYTRFHIYSLCEESHRTKEFEKKHSGIAMRHRYRIDPAEKKKCA